MRMRRRDVLKAATAAFVVSAVPPLSGCNDSGAPPAAGVFRHGVASGDPLPEAVILWTRATGDGGAPVTVSWEIAKDPAFSERVGGGTVTTDADRDFTVKVDATGL